MSGGDSERKTGKTTTKKRANSTLPGIQGSIMEWEVQTHPRQADHSDLSSSRTDGSQSQQMRPQLSALPPSCLPLNTPSTRTFMHRRPHLQQLPALDNKRENGSNSNQRSRLVIKKSHPLCLISMETLCYHLSGLNDSLLFLSTLIHPLE